MIKEKKEVDYKHFLKIQRRIKELEEIQRSIPPVKLEKPFQNGWEIDIVLSVEARRRQDYPVLQEALDFFTSKHKYHTKDSKLISSLRKNKRVSQSRYLFIRNIDKNVYYNGPELKGIRMTDKISIPKNIVKWTRISQNFYKAGSEMKYYEVLKHNIPEYLLEYRITKNMMTHQRGLDKDLESELSYLNHYFYNHLVHTVKTGWRDYPYDEKDPRNPKNIRRESKKQIKKCYHEQD